MKLSETIPVSHIIPELRSRDLEGSFREMVSFLSRIYTAITSEEAEELVMRLVEREEMCSTALESGVSIPHIYHKHFNRLVACLGRSPEGIHCGAEGPKVHFVVMLVVPQGNVDLHMLALSLVTRTIQREGLLQQLLACTDAEQIHELLAGQEFLVPSEAGNGN